MVTVGAGTRVVIPEPTFTLYALLTTILGGEATRVPMSSDAAGSFVYDVDALLAAGRASGASLTIVCSPNNPTGTSLSLAEVERLCGDGDGLVVIDEAYHEFAGASVVPLLARHPNLVVLRTLSKAMGMAGLRVGYLLASPELVREVNKARLPYNVNSSQLAALAALEEKEALAGNVRRLVAGRERLLARLADMPGVRAHASDANFFLLEGAAGGPEGRLGRHGATRRAGARRDLVSAARALPARERRQRRGERRLPARARDGAHRSGYVGREGTSVKTRAPGRRTTARGVWGCTHPPEQRKQAHRRSPVIPLENRRPIAPLL